MATLALNERYDDVPEPRIHTSAFPPVQTPTTPIWRTVLAGAADRGDHPALIDGVSGQTITYAQLLRDVCRCANALKASGVKKGDRVCIYLPMIPELPVAMLACARIGAVHSVVFGGFSADSLRNRILDSSCAYVAALLHDPSMRTRADGALASSA